MFLKVSLYISLIIFVLALIYKSSTWFRYKIGIGATEIPTAARFFSAIKGILSTIFSAKILTLLKVFVLDVLLQFRILREDFLRWLMHIFIYGGFILLLLMHALDKYVTVAIWKNYYSTINPFMFLRDLFGALVIVGVIIAIYRRFILKVPRMFTNAMDIYTIILVAVIMLSGIFLEATKMIAYSDYQRMVNEYSGLSDPQELKALEAYWVNEFGTVSPNLKGPFDEKTLAQGKDLHQSSCAECHARPQWAFAGYGTAKVISPIGLQIDQGSSPEHPLVYSYPGLFRRTSLSSLQQDVSHFYECIEPACQFGDGEGEVLPCEYRHPTGIGTGRVYPLWDLQFEMFGDHGF